MFKQKKGLGRGISSLIGDTKNTSLKNKISISEIVRGKYQPRKMFNKESLEELSNSIRERELYNQLLLENQENLITNMR